VHISIKSRPRDEKGRFVKINSEEDLPIDTTTIDDNDYEEKLIEEKKQFLINQTYILSNRLNQLRYDMRKTDLTDKERFEEQAIEKQIKLIKEEFKELEKKSKKK
jgi:hypothetical protein